MFGALRLIVEVNVLLCGGLVLAWVVAARGSGSHRQRLRFAQGVFVLAFALPLALRMLPQRPILPPAAQVWSGGDIGRVSSETLVGTTWLSGARELPLDNGVLALLLAGAGAAALGRNLWLAVRLLLLRRRLDALPSIRRIGRVSVVATSAEHVPFSAWLFGRAYVAIPETLVVTDISHYAIAVRHELAHHRQRDT
ncbi:MAG TPA: hypothetical protein VJU61_23780, partial [Polyangiaceae bacterium]|nr:hypothetical protein [Polyangiaceae bacterium]